MGENAKPMSTRKLMLRTPVIARLTNYFVRNHERHNLRDGHRLPLKFRDGTDRKASVD